MYPKCSFLILHQKKLMISWCINRKISHHFLFNRDRGNFKSRQKCQKILVAPCKMERFQLINNLFSAKFCRTFEITSDNFSLFSERIFAIMKKICYIHNQNDDTFNQEKNAHEKEHNDQRYCTDRRGLTCGGERCTF